MKNTERRSRRFELPFLRGSIDDVHALGRVYSGTDLAEFFARQRLCVSRSGRSIAHVVPTGDRYERIDHNLTDVRTSLLQRRFKGISLETRILYVDECRVVIWGLPVGKLEIGLYEYSASKVRHLCTTSDGQYFGMNHESFLIHANCATQNAYWNPGHAVHDTRVFFGRVLLDGSISFVEQIGHEYFRYLMTQNGLKDWAKISLEKNELPVHLVRLRGSSVLVTYDERQNLTFVSMLDGLPLLFGIPEVLEGVIEHVWVSPDERSLAWIHRPDPTSSFRYIYLNGVLLYEGIFEIGNQPISWSPLGTQCGISIRSLEAEYSISGEQYMVITPMEQMFISPKSFLREFLVGDDGFVASVIQDNAETCTVFVRSRPFAQALTAFNMHWLSSGGIGFNSIQRNVIQFISDETDIRLLP